MTPARAILLAWAIAVAALLSGCSGAPSQAFDLAAPPTKSAAARRTSIAVAEPSAAPNLDSRRILVRTSPTEVAVLADAEWADQLPDLVKARFADSLRNAGFASPEDQTAARYRLGIDIRHFELDAYDPGVTAELLVNVSPVDSPTRLFSASYRVSLPVASTSPSTVAAALNAAFADIAAKAVAAIANRF